MPPKMVDLYLREVASTFRENITFINVSEMKSRELPYINISSFLYIMQVSICLFIQLCICNYCTATFHYEKFPIYNYVCTNQSSFQYSGQPHDRNIRIYIHMSIFTPKPRDILQNNTCFALRRRLVSIFLVFQRIRQAIHDFDYVI